MGREGGSEGWRWHVAQKEDEKDWLSRLTDQHTAAGRAARGLACGADEKDRKEVRGGGVCRTTIDYFTMISHALRRATIVRGGGGECSQSECSHAATRARNTCRRSRALEQGSDDAASALNQRSHGGIGSTRISLGGSARRGSKGAREHERSKCCSASSMPCGRDGDRAERKKIMVDGRFGVSGQLPGACAAAGPAGRGQ